MSDPQAEVIAFLAEPGTWQPRPAPVRHIETHGAHVFLGADRVLKIKRAVRYDYMDFSTLGKRHAAIAREVEINRRFAPGLYIGAVAITREADGGLALGGTGGAVEWAVAMHRFPEEAVLVHAARRGPLGAPLVKALAAAVLASHRLAEPGNGRDPESVHRRLAADVAAGIAAAGDAGQGAAAGRFGGLAGRRLDAIGRLLGTRREAGRVRRCHGDLHLANIVVVDGRPTLFDALEFDEPLATVDTLYDLAFLLMDLDAAGRRADANLLLGHYLWLAGDDGDLDGLAALPLFLGLRAAIRAMVALQRRAATHGAGEAATAATADAYLARAQAYLAPPPPRLVAVGGLSGTGKSTLAAALAPCFGAAPGALHLRSDLERKRMHGCAETEPLPPEAYAPASSEAVYARLLAMARRALAAGHAVILDAVHQREAERQAVAALARELGVPFHGLWLTAPPATMVERITARRGDASDATADVAAAQLARGAGTPTWETLDAGRAADTVLAAACGALGLAGALEPRRGDAGVSRS